MNLRNKKMDINQQVKQAVENGNIDSVKDFIESGADVNHLFDNKSFLMIAAEKGDLEICKLLLEKGANINQTNKYDQNTLTIAALEGYRFV
jgi:ankyrin repeat protein